MSQKMLSAECNYEIYNKELLTIVKAFEEWRLECAGTAPDYSIKVLSDHKNLEHFMTTKQLNRRQARWAEFLVEFNFQISYRLETEGTKPDSLTRRFQDLPADNFDERRQFNNQVILKPKNLNVDVRNAVKLGEKIHQLKAATTKVAIMAYPDVISLMTTEIPKQNSDDDSDDNDEESDNPHSQLPASTEKQSNPSLNAANTSALSANSTTNTADTPTDTAEQIDTDTAFFADFLSRIQRAYKKNENLLAIMKAKKNRERKIPAKLIKKGIRLKLENCEIKFGVLWVKSRLHMSRKKSLRTAVIKHMHESLQKSYADRNITYERLSTHYYWQNITAWVARYVKTCHSCKRTKVYREAKQELLKPLLISDRYFKEITVDFITSLLICVRNGKNYQHIIIVIDRLFKTKKFAALNSLDVDAVMQTFINWI